MGLGYDTLPLGASDSSRKGSFDLRVSPAHFCRIFCLRPDTCDVPQQHLDKIHPPRHSRIFRFHDGFPPTLRLDRTHARLLARVHEYCWTLVVLARLLAYDLWTSFRPPHARLCMEIVSQVQLIFPHCPTELLSCVSDTNGCSDRNPTISFKKSKSTTCPTIVHGWSSSKRCVRDCRCPAQAQTDKKRFYLVTGHQKGSSRSTVTTEPGLRFLSVRPCLLSIFSCRD